MPELLVSCYDGLRLCEMHFSLLTALHERSINMYFFIPDILSCGFLSYDINPIKTQLV